MYSQLVSLFIEATVCAVCNGLAWIAGSVKSFIWEVVGEWKLESTAWMGCLFLMLTALLIISGAGVHSKHLVLEKATQSEISLIFSTQLLFNYPQIEPIVVYNEVNRKVNGTNRLDLSTCNSTRNGDKQEEPHCQRVIQRIQTQI